MAFLETIVILLVIIVIHEAGHFLLCVSLGIPVKSLLLGIPIPDLTFLPWFLRKLIWKIQPRIQLGRYPLFISPLLAGGGVVFDERVFWNSPLWKRILVLLAGPAANFLSVVVAGAVVTLSPAGFIGGFAVVGVTAALLIKLAVAIANGTIPLAEVVSQTVGPVGLVAFGGEMISSGAATVYSLFALMSVLVGLTNLLPIPALDGGQIATETLVSLGLPRLWARILTGIFLILLFVLIALITVRDVSNLF